MAKHLHRYRFDVCGRMWPRVLGHMRPQFAGQRRQHAYIRMYIHVHTRACVIRLCASGQRGRARGGEGGTKGFFTFRTDLSPPPLVGQIVCQYAGRCINSGSADGGSCAQAFSHKMEKKKEKSNARGQISTDGAQTNRQMNTEAFFFLRDTYILTLRSKNINIYRETINTFLFPHVCRRTVLLIKYYSTVTISVVHVFFSLTPTDFSLV